MPLSSTTTDNDALNSIDGSGGTPVNKAAFVQMHTASPSTTGANEMGSVTRQACSWNAASAAAKTQSSSLSFTTPNTAPATHAGTFSAVTAGTYGIGLLLASSVQAATITVAPGALSLGAS